jgi:glucose-1-phosphate thymidylyltransferase
MDLPKSRYSDDVVGIIPAAGLATRLSPLPFSKEVFPIGFAASANHKTIRPKAVCQYLLERLHIAGINKTYIVLRDGKWDIPAFLKDGYPSGMNLAYLIMRIPFGVPYSIDQAYPFVKDAVVALGFPDIIFQPEDAFVQLLLKHKKTNADVVLGLMPVADPQNWDMVDLAEDGSIRQIHIKRPDTDLIHAWFIAVWTPVFTELMHRYLMAHQRELEGQNRVSENRHSTIPEVHMSDVIRTAIDKGLSITSVIFPEGSCLDIGIPGNLIQAVKGSGFPSGFSLI